MTITSIQCLLVPLPQQTIMISLKDGNGNYYTIPGYAGTYQEMNNPLAMLFADKSELEPQVCAQVLFRHAVVGQPEVSFFLQCRSQFLGYEDSATTSCYYLWQ